MRGHADALERRVCDGAALRRASNVAGLCHAAFRMDVDRAAPADQRGIFGDNNKRSTMRRSFDYRIVDRQRQPTSTSSHFLPLEQITKK